MFYHFRDLNRVRAPSKGTRPVDAICFDGHWLDDEVEAFSTIIVEGRENFKRTINAQETSKDGSIYLTSRIPSKSLKITFNWKCDSIDDHNKQVQKLKMLLNKPEAEIKFEDEPTFHYIGTVEEINFEKALLTTKGTITIDCSNPFKFSDLKTISGKEKKFTISDGELLYETKPKQLKIIPSANGSKIEITNETNGKKLMANIAYSAGNEIIFDFDNLDFLVNKASHLMDIDLASNFDDFYIKDKDAISITVDGTYSLTYEVKQL